MDTVLGLIGMAIWIVGVIALAAGVTYAVIKVSPGDRAGKKSEEAPAESS
jgi:hypothetical protein